ncbi:hypothetical protein HHK36_029343 [Tetracentron sinense]|uniref:Chlorophyll a-b binding protein, chloroplastic n=1 Tax=Tetracentron sinense TaxID=13715 RepID=A0A835CZN0_TETSI|nr:hypothetical protein HHK36_029343 [Tetracentron sinense]
MNRVCIFMHFNDSNFSCQKTGSVLRATKALSTRGRKSECEEVYSTSWGTIAFVCAAADAPLLHGLMAGSLPGDLGFDPLGLAHLLQLGHLKPGFVNTNPIFPNNKPTGTDVRYPGELWFDPLGWGTSSPEKLKELSTKEIKTGRFAIVVVV